MFETVAPIFRDALSKSGYNYELKFDPNARQPRRKKRNRCKDEIWFNPPYSASVRTSIGREFLNLVDKCFPRGHPLRKIFNRNTLKVGYSCTPNIASMISKRNKKLLAPSKPDERLCSCTTGKICPLQGKCLSKDIIYQATVTQENQTTNTYTGLCSTEFKKRLAVHTQTFKDLTVSQTSLSHFIWGLKRKNINFSITWKILDRGGTFSPVSGKCGLCIGEKFYILLRPESANINSRDEVFSACRHKKPKLLIKPKKKRPG